jgi:hypothetical protein
MRPLRCILLLGTSIPGVFAQQPLTNDSVVKLVRAHIDDGIIIRLINSQQGQYVITTDAILALAQAGASNKVISSVMDYELGTANASSYSSNGTQKGDYGVKASGSSGLSDEFSQRKPPTRHNLATAPPPTPLTSSADSVLLADGTPVRLCLVQPISSPTSYPDQRILLSVVDDVLVDQKAIIQSGASAQGTIFASGSHRHLGQSGRLTMTVDWVKLPNGQKVTLRAADENEDRVSTGATNRDLRLNKPRYWIMAPLLAFRGKDAVIQPGRQFTAYVDGNFDIPQDVLRASGTAFKN